VRLDKDRTMDNVQKLNVSANVPSSRTFRSQLILNKIKHFDLHIIILILMINLMYIIYMCIHDSGRG
jgi:hypothetical protein